MDKSALADTAIELLRDLLAEVRGLRADLAERVAQPAPGAANAILLRSIHTAQRGREFTSPELWDIAERPDAKPLRAAIHAAVDGEPNPRKIGKLLSDIESDGAALDGLVVKRLGGERAGIIWQVCAANPL